MKERTSFFIAGLLVGALVATSGFALFLRGRQSRVGSDRNRVTLKLAHSLDPSHPVHAGLEFMKRRLEELSGGRATIDIYPSSVLGSEVECIEQLQNGALAMTKTSTAALEAFVPEFGVFTLPYIFRDEGHYWRVLEGPLGRELLLKAESRNLRGLCYYDSGSRNIYTVKKPVLTPDDLKGMKIRVMNSRTSMRMMEAFGAAPTPIAWGELYTALQQGTVDGAENNPPSFFSSRHYEVCKHFTLDAHNRIPDIILISARVWQALSPDIQRWLQRAADESTKFQRELWTRKTAEDLEACRRKGVTVYTPDTAPFAARVQELLKSCDGTPVGALLERIRSTP